MNRKLILMTAAACLLAGACAKNQASTTGQDAQKYLQLWMEKYHPGIAPTEDGLYLLAETPGTGLEWGTVRLQRSREVHLFYPG